MTPPIPCDQYMEDFDSYIERVEGDSSLFTGPTAPVPSFTAQTISLWYMGRHKAAKDD